MEEEEEEDWRIGGLRWGNDIVLLGLVSVEKNGVVRKVPRYTRGRYAASEVINSAKTTINSKSQHLYLLPPRNCTFAGRV